MMPIGFFGGRAEALMVAAMMLIVGPAPAAEPLTIAVAIPMSGGGRHIGPEIANAVRMAIDEVNHQGGVGGRPLAITVLDDATNPDTAAEIAQGVIRGSALAVIGHPHSPVALAAAPIYQQGGIVLLSSAAEDSLTADQAIFFRIVPALETQGRASALYAREGLGLDKATILYRDDTFGRALRQSFTDEFTNGRPAHVKAVALPPGPIDWERVAAGLATDPAPGLILLAMQDYDASRFLVAKRRHGIGAPVMGPQAVAREVFVTLFKDQPEEATQPGLFAEGVYAMAPAMLDTANKDTVDFAAAYETRFGSAPGWTGIKYYEAAKALAVALTRAAIMGRADSLRSDREALRTALAAMDSPDRAAIGLTGPVQFDAHRNRIDSFRVGRFQGGRFVSAPIQFVRVEDPGAVDLKRDLAADIIRKIGDEYYWRQRIVYTGVQPVSIDKIDTKEAFFTADFYMWMRFVERDGIAQVEFPDMVRGGYNPAQPVAQHRADGMIYLLYRIKGDFRNEFTLGDYPFDRQRLSIRLANSHLTREEVVYAVDSLPPGLNGRAESATAGRWRTPDQWDSWGIEHFRDDLVSKQALGDPAAVRSGRALEFSGFKTVMTVQRQVVVFLRKNLLALALLTLVVYSTLFYPESVLKERLTVPVAGMLSASVLLAGTQNKLGDIGYTTAAEVIFYVFFFVSLMATLSALVEERLRLSGMPLASMVVRRGSHILFPLTIAATAVVFALHYGDRF